MQARSGILASHLNSQKLLKQFSDELVKSLLEAVHIYSRLAVTVLLLSWTTFILDVNSKPKKTVQSDRQQAGTLPTLPVTYCNSVIY